MDLGGTAIKAGAFTPRGKPLAAAREPTGARDDPSGVIERVAAIVNRLRLQLGARPAAVGIGMPGVLDVARRTMIHSPNFPGWERFPVRSRLQKAIGGRVEIENDANAAALGELWQGAGRGIRNFLLITLGTGVGGGLVLDGRLWRGEHAGAGEFGHIKVEPDGLACGCGRRGCLEMYVSALAIRRMGREALAAGRAPRLAALTGGDPEKIDPLVVAQAARDGDAGAAGVYRAMARSLAMGIADVIHILDIGTFLLGGGMSRAFDLFHPWLMEEVERRIYGIGIGAISIRRASCGEEAGEIGAAYLALRSLKAAGR